MIKIKGLRITNWSSQNSSGDVKYSIGNVVINILIITDGVTRVQDVIICLII